MTTGEKNNNCYASSKTQTETQGNTWRGEGGKPKKCSVFFGLTEISIFSVSFTEKMHPMHEVSKRNRVTVLTYCVDLFLFVLFEIYAPPYLPKASMQDTFKFRKNFRVWRKAQHHNAKILCRVSWHNIFDVWSTLKLLLYRRRALSVLCVG